jgi:hypothetical protein
VRGFSPQPRRVRAQFSTVIIALLPSQTSQDAPPSFSCIAGPPPYGDVVFTKIPAPHRFAGAQGKRQRFMTGLEARCGMPDVKARGLQVHVVLWIRVRPQQCLRLTEFPHGRTHSTGRIS